MSLVVFSGAAQFAALSVLAAGGGPVAAIASRAADERALPADGLRHRAIAARRPLARAAQGQAVVDASFALASRGDGTFDRGLLMGATAPQALAWISGTIVGVLAGPVLGDPGASGSTRSSPPSTSRCCSRRRATGARDRRGWPARHHVRADAVRAAGVPVIAASLAALIGLSSA